MINDFNFDDINSCANLVVIKGCAVIGGIDAVALVMWCKICLFNQNRDNCHVLVIRRKCYRLFGQ